MRYGDALNIIEQRARRLGVQVDATELELAMYFQLQSLVDKYDLDAMTIDNPVIAVTDSGIESYRLPEDFGRLLHPHSATNRIIDSGFRLYASSTDISDLTYKRPQDFGGLDRVTTGRPTDFTIMNREIFLNPVPNSNDDDNYRIQGTYIMYVGTPDLDDEIPINEPSYLVTSALYQIAVDTPNVSPKTITTIAAEYNEQRSAIVNGQARVRQALYNSQERAGRGYR